MSGIVRNLALAMILGSIVMMAFSFLTPPQRNGAGTPARSGYFTISVNLSNITVTQPNVYVVWVGAYTCESYGAPIWFVYSCTLSHPPPYINPTGPSFSQNLYGFDWAGILIDWIFWFEITFFISYILGKLRTQTNTRA